VADGEAGLLDRPSTPHRQPLRTAEGRVQAIAALRRLRMTGAQIAELLGMPLSTVSGILTRIGLGRLSRLEPPEPPNRYERRHAGELIHIDVKKLGRIQRGAGHRVTGNRGPGQRARGAGWEYVHIAIDDATRLAYVEVLDDEQATTAIGFLRRALAFYRRHGIRVQRVMPDNGSAYISIAHALACRALNIRHLRTRPYRPRTNGTAERFIRTLLAGWAYGAIYRDSHQRTAALCTGRRRPSRRSRSPRAVVRPSAERVAGDARATKSTPLPSTTVRRPELPAARCRDTCEQSARLGDARGLRFRTEHPASTSKTTASLAGRCELGVSVNPHPGPPL
jgi:transposase InsO family protein